MTWVRSVLLRSALFALGWFAVTEGDAGVAAYGSVAIPLAAGTSLLLTSGPGDRAPGPRRVASVVSLGWWVLGRSLVGGVDVARRALRPSRPDVEPYWTTYHTSLPSEAARVAFALVLNLMPGTLSAHFDGDRFEVHVISPDLEVMTSLADLERRVRSVF